MQYFYFRHKLRLEIDLIQFEKANTTAIEIKALINMMWQIEK